MSASEGQPDSPFKMEDQLHRLQSICTIVDYIVDALLSPSNGWRDGGQLVFRLDEVDTDALCWATIEAKSLSRHIYDD